MKQAQTQVVLDSCVVIDLIEKPKVAFGLKARLKGKSVRIVLCDTVLGEVRRVRGLAARTVIEKIARILGRKVEISNTGSRDRDAADEITGRYQICHAGDNRILSICKARNFVLVTFDRMLLRACEFEGVPGFHPSAARGI